MTGVSRRFVLAGLLSGAAGAALADAPLASLRPVPRAVPGPGAAAAASGQTAAPTRTAPAAEALVAAAQLGGKVGFVVADARTGLILTWAFRCQRLAVT